MTISRSRIIIYTINVGTLDYRRGCFGRSLCQCFIAGTIEIIQRNADRVASIIALERNGVIRILRNGGIGVSQIQRGFVTIRILQFHRRLVAGIRRLRRRIGRRIQFVVGGTDSHQPSVPTVAVVFVPSLKLMPPSMLTDA